jgi:putative ABC transport system permease protein
VMVEGRSIAERADEQPFANIQLVDANYFRVMRIPLPRGRAFAETDREGTPAVAIVNERAARRFWGAEDPLGKRIRLIWNQSGTGTGGGSDLVLTVVGVAGNVRFRGIDDESALDVYAPHTQLFAGDSYLVARTRMNPEGLATQVRAAIDRVDPEQSFFDVATAEDRVNGSIWQHRVAAAVLSVFAAVALVLATIGTYAVTAYAVASQQRELGIRLALGSSTAGAMWLVVRRSLLPFGAGAAIGLAAGAAAARALAALIGLETAPAIGSVAVLPAILLLSAILASYLPAHWSLRRMAVADTIRT